MFFNAGTALNKEPIFIITGTKLYVPLVISSTEGNLKLLKQLEQGFKRAINWNKYQSKLTESGDDTVRKI